MDLPEQNQSGWKAGELKTEKTVPTDSPEKMELTEQMDRTVKMALTVLLELTENLHMKLPLQMALLAQKRSGLKA